MNKKSISIGALILLLLLIGAGLNFCGIWRENRMPAVIPPPPATLPATSTAPVAPTALPTPTPAPAPVPKSPPKHPAVSAPASATTPAGIPIPPKIELHKELIPKDITIVRCYYGIQGIAPPGTTFGFDINGSGFTSEFQKMIKVESGVEHVRVRNLRLVTTNQIHGEMVVEDAAATAFAYPRVLIKGLPVFSAPDPFAVVRPGEVLTIYFISMEENGRGGRFRVLTNINEDQFKDFQVMPSTPGLAISSLEPRLPYVVEGELHIGPGVPPGGYGLIVTLSGQKIFHHDDMIHIVRPNVGQTGYVLGLIPADRYHRPGDTVELYLQGTGLARESAGLLGAKVDEFDMGPGSFTYLSPSQMRVAFKAPLNTPVASYGVTVNGGESGALFHKAEVFQIVPANWIAGVQVAPPVKPGGQSTLKILGRDFSADFLDKFRIDLDEPGISVTHLQAVDPTTLSADITVSPNVAPGDYWLHLSENGKKIDPPFGSIIKVQAR